MSDNVTISEVPGGYRVTCFKERGLRLDGMTMLPKGWSTLAMVTAGPSGNALACALAFEASVIFKIDTVIDCGHVMKKREA